MNNAFFQNLETFECKQTLSLNEVIEQLVFNDRGLIPVVTQEEESKEVLMLAWMNKAALQHTLEIGRMTYWSRSRNEIWVKGSTSGNWQLLKSMHFDCDGDAVLCRVTQQGGACHTERKSCFYIEADYSKSCAVVYA